MATTHPTHSIPEWTLGDRLGKALDHAGVSVAEMAQYLDVSRNTIGNYTGGRTRPQRAVLLAWALRTGVPYEWLRDGTTASGPDTPDDQGITRRGWNGSRVVALNTRRPRPTMSTERPAA